MTVTRIKCNKKATPTTIHFSFYAVQIKYRKYFLGANFYHLLYNLLNTRPQFQVRVNWLGNKAVVPHVKHKIILIFLGFDSIYKNLILVCVFRFFFPISFLFNHCFASCNYRLKMKLISSLRTY